MNPRPLFLALLLAAPPLLQAGPVSPSSNDSEFQIPYVETYGHPDQPMVSLVKAVNAHPKRQRFHVWWGLAGTHGYSYQGELIYSKSQGILWIKFSRQGESDEDLQGNSTTSVWTQLWRWGAVTPQRLRALNACYAGKGPTDEDVPQTATDVSFFPQLRVFGCRGGLIKSTVSRLKHKA